MNSAPIKDKKNAPPYPAPKGTHWVQLATNPPEWKLVGQLPPVPQRSNRKTRRSRRGGARPPYPAPKGAHWMQLMTDPPEWKLIWDIPPPMGRNRKTRRM